MIIEHRLSLEHAQQLAMEALTKDQDFDRSPCPYIHIICVGQALQDAFDRGYENGKRAMIPPPPLSNQAKPE